MIGQFLLLQGSRRRWLDALVRQVAEQCMAAVYNRTAGRVEAMGVCETRGYIRARAGTLVRRHARAAVERVAAADPAWEQALVSRATERVVALVMRQLATAAWRSPASVTPALRRAA